MNKLLKALLATIFFVVCLLVAYVLRMRYGAKVETQAPLARAAGDNQELADELLVIEMQLFKAMKASKRPHLVSVPSERNAAKDKIVRSLKTRKK